MASGGHTAADRFTTGPDGKSTRAGLWCSATLSQNSPFQVTCPEKRNGPPRVAGGS